MRLLLVTLLILFSNNPKEIAKINSIKKEAEKAYLSGDYRLAALKYSLLLDSLNVEDDLIKLNLGHAYFNLGDTSGAKLSYEKLGMSSDKKLKSIAYQQLGVMSKEAGKLEQSLQQLKSAIKANPANEDAIYNYEVIKKLLEEQKEQQQQQNQDKENQDQNEEKDEEQNKDQKNQDQQNKDGEQEQKDQQGQNQDQSDEENKEQQQNKEEQEQQKGEQEEQQQENSQEQMTRDKLEEMGISEEKARQLLEAMRQSEIKYLQNQKRKATKRPPSGKPDW